MSRPNILSHVVFWTTDIDKMLEWYLAVTKARIAFRNPMSCFITFDDEHHRLGFLYNPKLTPRTGTEVGLSHVALRWENLEELINVYEELSQRGIVPAQCTNHGPTTSFYYDDPDGNRVELLYDNFATVEEAQSFMATDTFRQNPMGLAFDPEQLLRNAKAGVPVSRLVAYEALP